MTDDETADLIEAQFRSVKKRCDAGEDPAEPRRALSKLMDAWTHDARFLAGGNLTVRVGVLNQIAFLLSHPQLGDLAQQKLRQVARETTDEDANGMRISLTIATFEVAAELPEVPWFLEYLFSLADDPATRWAVFDAHERWPGRFRQYLQEYGRERISEQEYLEWLATQGLELTARGLRFRRSDVAP